MANDFGWGDPSFIEPHAFDPPYAWGWGAPTPDPIDGAGGWGGPFSVVAAVQIEGVAVFPDDGALAKVLGNWPIRGPYKVTLINANGVTFPTDGVGCYSAIPDALDGCRTNGARDTLTFTLPALPPGVYDLSVTWEGGSILLAAAIEVVPRARPLPVYSMRSDLPSATYLTGPRRLQDESELAPVTT